MDSTNPLLAQSTDVEPMDTEHQLHYIVFSKEFEHPWILGPIGGSYNQSPMDTDGEL